MIASHNMHLDYYYIQEQLIAILLSSIIFTQLKLKIELVNSKILEKLCFTNIWYIYFILILLYVISFFIIFYLYVLNT